jgi:hypothetical protein
MQLFRSKRESPEDFWKRTEEELGETVSLYTIGKCKEGCVEGGREIWGLFFVTERALYFRHFPSTNWFAALAQTATSTGFGREEVYFSVPLADIENVELQREPSLLRRLLSYTPPELRVTYRDRSGSPALLRFIPEMKQQELKNLLERG